LLVSCSYRVRIVFEVRIVFVLCSYCVRIMFLSRSYRVRSVFVSCLYRVCIVFISCLYRVRIVFVFIFQTFNEVIQTVYKGYIQNFKLKLRLLSCILWKFPSPVCRLYTCRNIWNIECSLF
jgi:hypothetical protein